ncbi:stage II sporulation protein D [Cohnella zeiphila]|uniref:Stage II sporulation protein D n=1 Tax=Cohnella zeiphila TaxID=2761120 RepID=A0A7X0VWX9_9BACL|nr:stage II sporulation protein D [Cohnella zeiphila]MBB6732970.1 stage II sporulation protein D [Cohnella zeiphila]
MLRWSIRRSTNYPWWTDVAAFAGGIAVAGTLWASLHGGPGHPADPEEQAAVPPHTIEKPAEHAHPKSSASPKTQDKPSEKKEKVSPAAPAAAWSDSVRVRVYLSGRGAVETVPLETYVRGVVAAEMPLSFEPAALEAQALAARTYIVRKLLNNDRTGVPAGGADTIDTQDNQVYRSEAEMDELKRTDPSLWSKANEAALRTKGQILVYDGQPIEALYFSSSNGFTENSEEVFPESVPYLRSVASPWDREEASNWETTSEISVRDFYGALGVQETAKLARAGAGSSIRIVDRTPGRRVKTLAVGGQEWTGEEVREKLGLRSAAFTLDLDKKTIVITSYGNGHGVGMSQWGAEGMAKEGYSASQIVSYYYTGIKIEDASKLAGAAKL